MGRGREGKGKGGSRRQREGREMGGRARLGLDYRRVYDSTGPGASELLVTGCRRQLELSGVAVMSVM